MPRALCWYPCLSSHCSSPYSGTSSKDSPRARSRAEGPRGARIGVREIGRRPGIEEPSLVSERTTRLARVALQHGAGADLPSSACPRGLLDPWNSDTAYAIEHDAPGGAPRPEPKPGQHGIIRGFWMIAELRERGAGHANNKVRSLTSHVDGARWCRRLHHRRHTHADGSPAVDGAHSNHPAFLWRELDTYSLRTVSVA